MDLTLGILAPAFVTLGVAQWVIGLLTVGFLACSVLLILTVLIQRPQGGGLSGAFGAGAGSGDTAFGARTGDALTIATISFFVLWLAVAVGLVLVMSGSTAPPAPPAATSNQGPVGPEATPEGGAQPSDPAGGEPAPGGADAPAGDDPAAGSEDNAAPTDGTTPPTEGEAGGDGGATEGGDGAGDGDTGGETGGNGSGG